MQLLHLTRLRTSGRRPRGAVVGAALLTLTLAASAPPAFAQAVAAPAASAFGAEVSITGTPLVPGTPSASVPAPTGDDTNTLVDVPVPPVIVSGTLTATANVHATRDLASSLTVVTQELAGPYQARALAEVENLGLVYEVSGVGVPLLSAAAVRAEAVAVCSATPTYSGNSEIIDLAIAGTPVPLNAPVETLIDTLTDVLQTSGLNAVVDVQRNVVTQLPGGGVSVDALIVTVLSAIGDAPLATIRIGHAEVTATACPPPAQCSDLADNDADGVADTADPGCHTDGNPDNAASFDPNDNDERNAPQCSDGRDNDGDAVADTSDPGCHTDGDATNAASFDPTDNDERNAPECSDGRDNDGDAVADARDPGCHTDGDATNAASFDPNDNKEADEIARAVELPRTGGALTGAAGFLLLGSAVAAGTLRRRLAMQR